MPDGGADTKHLGDNAGPPRRLQSRLMPTKGNLVPFCRSRAVVSGSPAQNDQATLGWGKELQQTVRSPTDSNPSEQ